MGTGEGQVARRLAQAGVAGRVVAGVDLSAAQIVEAARRGGGPTYARSAAAALPFVDDAFDDRSADVPSGFSR